MYSPPSSAAVPASADGSDAGLEHRFELLINSVQDYGIFLLDPQGRVVTWNPGAQRLKGYRREEILGRHFSIFYPEDAVARGWPEEELARASQQGRFEDEGWRVRKDGTRFWANVVITAMFGPDGELTGFGKITRDLSERRQQEEQLRASEERFRMLVESVREYAIFMLDTEGHVRSWNSGAQAIKGYAAAEVLGRHFSLFFPPEDVAAGKPQRELERAARLGAVEDEGWRVRKDGSMFWANVVISAVYGPDGQLRGFAKVTRDMTERRRLEELERTSRRMNEFLAMLAHELRNPLAPIRNAVSLMQLESLPTPALRESRDVIDRQLAHVTRLVDDLLDAGRLSTGKIKLVRKQVSLEDVVARAVETAGPLMAQRRHTLVVEPSGERLVVEGDATRLAQVLQNLLVNAAKYTPEGGHVRVRMQRVGGFANVSVQDNGRGIGAHELERIFDLFGQGEGGSPTESGLGIGLTLARHLTELHGGSLDAASAGPGQGSTFSLRLPLVEAAVAAKPLERAPEIPPAARGRMRVLVVDDNRDAADSLCEVIALLGHEVECAYSGEAALEIAQAFQPQLVLMDLAMPDLSGFDTRARLARLPGLEGVRTVALTGYGNESDKQRTREAGFDRHLTKPVDLAALSGLLEGLAAQ